LDQYLESMKNPISVKEIVLLTVCSANFIRIKID
jgi:hypothetical protein